MSWTLVEMSSGRAYYRGAEGWRRLSLAELRQAPLGIFRVVFDLKAREIIGCANPIQPMLRGRDLEELIEPDELMAMIDPASRQVHAEYLMRASQLADGESLQARIHYQVPGLGEIWLTHRTRVLFREDDGSARLLVTDLLPEA